VVFFALWGNGGPNFVRELRQWEVEESRAWSVVGSKSYADIVRQPLSGANLVPLGRHNTSSPRPSLASVKVSFLSKLSSEARDDLEDVIAAGHTFSQILHCFRFDHEDRAVISPLDSLSPAHLQELRDLIALNLLEDQLAIIFRGNPGGNTQQTTIPVSSVFNRVTQSLPSASGNPGVQNNSSLPSRPRVSAFDRLQEPLPAQVPVSAQPPGPRVSAFQRLQRPPTRPLRNDLSRPTNGPTCPRCLLPGHIRRDCRKRIKCHACHREGHVKIDCLFSKNLPVKTQWVSKGIHDQPKESTDMHNSMENSNRRIKNPTAGIAEPSLDLTLGPRNIPHKDQAPMVNVDLPLLPQLGPVVAVPPPSQSPPPNPGLHCSSAPASASSELLAGAAMANFVVDPVPFLPGDY
jgi:hypothetical protein